MAARNEQCVGPGRKRVKEPAHVTSRRTAGNSYKSLRSRFGELSAYSSVAVPAARSAFGLVPFHRRKAVAKASGSA
jgi:hypothetical protein